MQMCTAYVVSACLNPRCQKRRRTTSRLVAGCTTVAVALHLLGLPGASLAASSDLLLPPSPAVKAKPARPPRDLVDKSRFAVAVYKHGAAAEAEALVRLGTAVVVGAVIGAERRAASASAGVRTLALVSLGAAVFTLTSLLALTGDGARMGAAVCTGVGFLGAGAIHRDAKRTQRHLVTAASVWISAALGVASAAGLKFLALIAAAATVGILRWTTIYTIFLNSVWRVKLLLRQARSRFSDPQKGTSKQ